MFELFREVIELLQPLSRKMFNLNLLKCFRCYESKLNNFELLLLRRYGVIKEVTGGILWWCVKQRLVTVGWKENEIDFTSGLNGSRRDASVEVYGCGPWVFQRE